MVLGTAQGVTDLCKNTDSALIDRMLIKARARLIKRLAKEGITTPASDTDLDTAVEAIAAKFIGIGPGAVNPRTGFEVDGFSRKDGSKSQLDEWQDIADESIADYISTITVSTSPLPSMTVVGRRGVRTGEYTDMTEAQEDVY